MTKERLGESASELYKAVTKLTMEGVVTPKGIMYPVVYNKNNYKYYIVGRDIEVIVDSGFGRILATDSELNSLDDAMENDEIDIYLMTNWGNGRGREIFRTLHRGGAE